ncbi:hypothetical protein HBK87_06760 [Streptomyces sp. 2BBP-J2]|uniref:hypothetical protein n=1 Tax=Streptomyces sp. 2BBP-J2 TaxID=2719381 RepID=UPI0014317035|nr:hypothetical protein [Streptomyces sp. 2BBP-J2]NIL50296.1 hypothetical protein [Streptomyces sp. 2BBP-J2]
MHPRPVDEDSRLSLWRRVREYAVPPTMIETATARRRSGDWAGACAAARVDVDLRLRDLTRIHGVGLAAQVRVDLRYLAPDLLRWHMPRTAPDGLLRPGLTVPLARYTAGEPDECRPVYLVVRTPPAWAAGGQRMSLALWDGHRLREGSRGHPRPRPGRRFRFDLHRHLWDARRAHELPHRSGRDAPRTEIVVPSGLLPPGHHYAVDRWADEARILLRDAGRGRTGGSVAVRLDARRRLVLDLSCDGHRPVAVSTEQAASRTTPLLPDAATHVLPDLALLRAGAIDAGRLHPMVASALAPGHPVAPEAPPQPGTTRPHTVLCQGVPHRVALVDGVLVPLDHTPDEIRREELLAELTGTPLPCLQFVDRAHRRPDCLTGVRERLDHGDVDGALAVVENLLGPDACLRDGPLKDALEEAALRRLAHGLHRAGLRGPADHWILPAPARRRDHRTHPRHAISR